MPRPAGVAKSIELHDLISTHSQCGLVVTKRGKSRSSPINVSTLPAPPPPGSQPRSSQAPSTPINTATAQPKLKIQSTLISKVEEWLSEIVNSLRNKGGSPVDLSGLSNPAQGGVPRPAGVAKNIELHDLISTHSQCGLVVTKRGKSLLSHVGLTCCNDNHCCSAVAARSFLSLSRPSDTETQTT